MTFTFEQETWLKVTTHPFPKSTLWLKYEPGWAKRRGDMLRTRDPGRTDGWTDGGQTDG